VAPVRANPLRALRSRAAPLIKTALLHAGGYAALRRLLPSRRVAILRYHAICGKEGYRYADPGICISPRAFEDHVRYLAANYAVLPLGEVVDRLRAGRPLPSNAVSITFDDGYADNVVHHSRLSCGRGAVLANRDSRADPCGSRAGVTADN
jgi:hypothetical protein